THHAGPGETELRTYQRVFATSTRPEHAALLCFCLNTKALSHEIEKSSLAGASADASCRNRTPNLFLLRRHHYLYWANIGGRMKRSLITAILMTIVTTICSASFIG